MAVNLKDLLKCTSSLTIKALPLALSFVDDILFLLLAKLGISLPGLAWLGPTLLIGTLLFNLTRWAINNHTKYVAVNM